jgi:hypothetical protein
MAKLLKQAPGEGGAYEQTTQTTGSLAPFLAAAALTGHRHCLHWQQMPQSCGGHVHGGGQSQLQQHVPQT